MRELAEDEPWLHRRAVGRAGRARVAGRDRARGPRRPWAGCGRARRDRRGDGLRARAEPAGSRPHARRCCSSRREPRSSSERWLAPLARGELRGTVAVWDEHSGWAPDRSEVELSAERTLSCVKIAVPDAASADFLIVSGADGRHWLVERSADGVSIEPEEAIDPTRKLFRVELSGAPAEPLQLASEALGRCLRDDRHAARGRERRRRVSARWRWPSPTPRTATSSTARSAPTRRSRTAARRCCSRSRDRARSVTGRRWALDHEPETAAAGRLDGQGLRR